MPYKKTLVIRREEHSQKPGKRSERYKPVLLCTEEALAIGLKVLFSEPTTIDMLHSAMASSLSQTTRDILTEEFLCFKVFAIEFSSYHFIKNYQKCSQVMQFFYYHLEVMWEENLFLKTIMPFDGFMRKSQERLSEYAQHAEKISYRINDHRALEIEIKEAFVSVVCAVNYLDAKDIILESEFTKTLLLQLTTTLEFVEQHAPDRTA